VSRAAAGPPPFDLRILVARTGDRAADVLARVKQDPGTLPVHLMVGQAARVDGDGDPGEEWKAWLWPKAGAYPAMDGHTAALTRPSRRDLEAQLNMRLKDRGRWWS
jgi:hypothetical protein